MPGTDNLTKAGRSGSRAVGRMQVTNLVILGKQGVGKTTIFRQFRGYFDPKSCANPSRLEMKNEKAHISVFDISLPESLNRICMRSVSKADGFMLVFDLTDIGSFEYAEKVKDFLIERKGKGFPIVVVGNKSDLPERSVKSEIADCLISIDWEMKYVEVSAIIDDVVPVILESLFPKTNEGDVIGTDGALDSFEPHGPRKVLSHAKTESSLLKDKKRVNRERIRSLVDQGILPEHLRQRRFRQRLSLPNFFIRKQSTINTNESSDGEISEKVANRPTLISRLLVCVKGADSMHDQ